MSTRASTAPRGSRRCSCSPKSMSHAPAAASAAHVVLRVDRKVDRQATVSGVRRSTRSHQLIGERVWVRAVAEQLIVVHIDPDQGPREVPATC